MSQPAAPLRQKLDALFQPWNRSDAPGAMVGIAYKGEVIYRRGFGLASLEHARVNAPDTRSRIGSTTKHFCALGVMLLAEEGRLDIHQPVRTYLPELTGVCGEPTLLQLMHHTGGLHDPSFAAFFLNGGNFGYVPAGANLEMMGRFTERNFAPGERMAYSNSGYFLLTLVTERVSGQSWEAFMTARVFAPLGMFATALLRSDMEIVPNMATLHMPQADGSWRRGIYPTDELLGSGGMISTVDDMLIWARHLRSAQKTVGSAATWAKMLEKPAFASGQQTTYCLGLAVDRHRGVEIIHHAGATLGAQCQMLVAPKHELDIVILANRMDLPAPTLALKILETVLEDEGLEPATVPAGAAEFPTVQGRWYSRSSRTLLNIEPKNLKLEWPEVLLVSLFNAPVSVLLKSGAGLALPEGPMSSLEIRELPASARPDTLDVHIVGDRERFERLPETAPAADALAPALAGRYRYATFGKEIELVLRDGKLFLDFLPPYGYARWELEPYSDDLLGCGVLHTVPAPVVSQQAVLSLDRRDGHVTGFWLSMDRVRGVRFDRC